MLTVFNAVTIPTCKGNDGLINTGASTLPNAIPIPINRIPVNNNMLLPNDRR